MPVANQAVTFTPEQVIELHRKLAAARHNLNNHLSLILAAVELLRRKPELAARMADTLLEPPRKIMDEVAKFSADFDRAFGITTDESVAPTASPKVS